MLNRALLVAMALAVIGCESEPFDSSVGVGGVDVSAAALNRGKQLYDDNCRTCHGERGDGRGPSAANLWPRPRDFTRAKFKYAGIEDRGLPHDDELRRIIQNGLAGSAMMAWDLPDEQVQLIVDYIKTFSRDKKGFRNNKLKVKRPTLPADPYADAASRRKAIAAGERIYHELFQCAKCHPAYVAAGTYDGLRGGALHEPVPKWSENYRAVLLPTDFVRHRMRSVRNLSTDTLDHSAADLYRVVAYGLQGPMPGSLHLGADNIWQVVHYVKSLADKRGTTTAAAMAASRAAQ